MKFFTRAGAVLPERHYFVPHRLNKEEICELIARAEYFVLHAPRQSGKTTAIQELVRDLNIMGNYHAVYINVESAQAAHNDIEKALVSILASLRSALKQESEHGFANEETLHYLNDVIGQKVPITINSFHEALTFWAEHSGKPIALFIDEIDALIGDSLLSVLRQIRSGYDKRAASFPQSICLIGLKDVRDYKVWSQQSGQYISAASPFNIKSESLQLANFSIKEVADLLAQHTHETGQLFEEAAVDYLYELTQGQPWLVNALAYQAAFVDVKDRAQPITKAIIDSAKETLIRRRDTHLDSLVDKLRDERVRPIIDAILQGQTEIIELLPDSLQYVRDLGLIKSHRMEIANPIYQEIIPRELTETISQGLAERYVLRPGYVRPDGSLDMERLLEVFTEFYRENAAIWNEKFAYKESGPHLLLMAFLQRIVNGGGIITREYALGRGRVDLVIKWKKQRIVLELKIYHRSDTLKKGLNQTADYMDVSDATEGYLLIFCRNLQKPWKERFKRSHHILQNHKIDVWQM